jgi:hypothetical protein
MKGMPALVFQNLGFDLGPRKLVVFRTDRNDLPHLTLALDNHSGEIDLHFTPVHPKDRNDRNSIMKVPQTLLAEYFINLGEQFATLATTRIFKLFFPVRGEWLRQNYFKVLEPCGESFEEWFIRASPKLRGKYRTDINTLREIPRHSLRQPTTQRLIELRATQQVWAVCTQGWDKGRVLVLHYMGWRPGVMTWVAIDYDDAPEFCDAFQLVIAEPVDTLISDIIQRIRNELCLEELGL